MVAIIACHRDSLANTLEPPSRSRSSLLGASSSHVGSSSHVASSCRAGPSHVEMEEEEKEEEKEEEEAMQ